MEFCSIDLSRGCSMKLLKCVVPLEIINTVRILGSVLEQVFPVDQSIFHRPDSHVGEACLEFDEKKILCMLP